MKLFTTMTSYSLIITGPAVEIGLEHLIADQFHRHGFQVRVTHRGCLPVVHLVNLKLDWKYKNILYPHTVENSSTVIMDISSPLSDEIVRKTILAVRDRMDQAEGVYLPKDCPVYYYVRHGDTPALSEEKTAA